ncbi:MAG: TVP38/TMEM64 family protein [Acetivibrio ethanolgignens]
MKNKKLGIFAGAVILVLILNHSFGWSSYIGDMDNLKRLEGIVQDNLLLALVIYIGFTIAGCVVLALPGVTFAIAAGLLFGPLLGTVCCSMATTIGAMMAFAAGRFFLKDSVKPVVIKNRYLKRWLFDESEKNEVFVLMLTRLVPLFPYNLQNFAYGITDIKFSTYSICSLIFMLPGTAMYTVGAAGLTDRENRLLYIGIAAFLAVIVTGLGVFLKKRYMQKEQITEDGRKG